MTICEQQSPTVKFIPDETGGSVTIAGTCMRVVGHPVRTGVNEVTAETNDHMHKTWIGEISIRWTDVDSRGFRDVRVKMPQSGLMEILP